MDLVAENYQDNIRCLKPPSSSEVKFYSSLEGHLIKSSVLESSYWVDNLTQPVRFSEAVTRMCEPLSGHKTGVDMIIEIGPHSALAGPIKQIMQACGPDATKISYSSALVRKKNAVDTTLDLASVLFVKGAAIDLGAINLQSTRKPPKLLVDMPRYPCKSDIPCYPIPNHCRKSGLRAFLLSYTD